jgi:hypothetical protein
MLKFVMAAVLLLVGYGLIAFLLLLLGIACLLDAGLKAIGRFFDRLFLACLNCE